MLPWRVRCCMWGAAVSCNTMHPKPGSQVFEPDQILDQVLAGPELRGYVEEGLDVRARQARAVVSSWSVEGWMERDAAGRVAAMTSSVDARCDKHSMWLANYRQENGRKGGRPRTRAAGSF